VAWYHALGFGQQPSAPEPPALTAAASIVAQPRSPLLKTPDSWQREAWDFYDELGEFNFGIVWLSNMMSRVRLRAARLDPDLDEPSISDVPPDAMAAKLLKDLAGGVGGQAQMMRGLVTQLSVPGEGYLIGEQIGDTYSWMVRSAEEVRATSGKFQVVGGRIPNVTWVDLESESLVVRVWRPHARFYHVADSPARSARPIMRELDLVNRHIIAQYLSRLASAGVYVIPEEASFPVREEFADEPDPMSAEWVELAAEAIGRPGTASAIVPLLMRVPADLADKIKFHDFTLKIDEKVIEKRNSAIDRLATKLDIPTEVLTGMGKVNHWTAWQLDEGALKTHIAPMAELICDSLTRGYLQPRLAASGEKDIGQWVVWYDMSELAIRPDRSTNAQDAYDKFELSGEALRREGGFDEDDKPDDKELEEMALKALLKMPALASSALDALLGKTVLKQPVASEPASGGNPVNPQNETVPPPGTAGPPGTAPPGQTPPSGKPPSGSPPKVTSDHVLDQLRAPHAVRFSGTRPPTLLHPPLCRNNAYGCPFTHAAEDAHLTRLATGTYECRLGTLGQFTVGASVPYLDTTGWIPTGTTVLSRKGRANGSRVRV
jgi:hypothetical protein